MRPLASFYLTVILYLDGVLMLDCWFYTLIISGDCSVLVPGKLTFTLNSGEPELYGSYSSDWFRLI